MKSVETRVCLAKPARRPRSTLLVLQSQRFPNFYFSEQRFSLAGTGSWLNKTPACRIQGNKTLATMEYNHGTMATDVTWSGTLALPAPAPPLSSPAPQTETTKPNPPLCQPSGVPLSGFVQDWHEWPLIQKHVSFVCFWNPQNFNVFIYFLFILCAKKHQNKWKSFLLVPTWGFLDFPSQR
jgi:hypothetical protein